MVGHSRFFGFDYRCSTVQSLMMEHSRSLFVIGTTSRAVSFVLTYLIYLIKFNFLVFDESSLREFFKTQPQDNTHSTVFTFRAPEPVMASILVYSGCFVSSCSQFYSSLQSFQEVVILQIETASLVPPFNRDVVDVCYWIVIIVNIS